MPASQIYIKGGEKVLLSTSLSSGLTVMRYLWSWWETNEAKGGGTYDFFFIFMISMFHFKIF